MKVKAEKGGAEKEAGERGKVDTGTWHRRGWAESPCLECWVSPWRNYPLSSFKKQYTLYQVLPSYLDLHLQEADRQRLPESQAARLLDRDTAETSLPTLCSCFPICFFKMKSQCSNGPMKTSKLCSLGIWEWGPKLSLQPSTGQVTWKTNGYPQGQLDSDTTQGHLLSSGHKPDSPSQYHGKLRVASGLIYLGHLR